MEVTGFGFGFDFGWEGSNSSAASLDFINQNYSINGVSSSLASLPGWNFQRSSVGTALDSSGNVISFASGQPRITDLGILIEEARTNSLLNSNLPVTQTTGSLSTGTYTLWVVGTGSATVTAGTGVATGLGTATAATPITFVVGTAGTFVITVIGSLSFFQLENGAAPTSRIITTTAAATRAEDLAYISGSWLPPWTTYAKVQLPTIGLSVGGILQLDDGSNANALRLADQNGFGGFSSIVLNASSAIFIGPAAAGTANVVQQLAVSAGSGYQAGALNGTATSGSGTSPVGPLTQLNIGGLANASLHCNGYIQRVTLLQALSSAAQLAVMTQ